MHMEVSECAGEYSAGISSESADGHNADLHGD